MTEERYNKAAEVQRDIIRTKAIIDVLNTSDRVVLSVERLHDSACHAVVLVNENSHEIFQVIRQYTEDELKLLQEEFEAL